MTGAKLRRVCLKTTETRCVAPAFLERSQKKAPAITVSSVAV